MEEKKEVPSFEEYSHSITSQMKEIRNSFNSKFFEKIVREGNTGAILKELNDSEKVITPAFILRRYTQKLHPGIFEEIQKEAEKKLEEAKNDHEQNAINNEEYKNIKKENEGISDYVDLQYQENVRWTTTENKDDENNFIHRVTKKLIEKIKSDTEIEYESGTLEGYLRGETIPRSRKDKIKLIFAFRMNLEHADKFLFSCGDSPLSERSPLDYIVAFAVERKYKYSWFTDCLKCYEEGRKDKAQQEESIKNTKFLRNFRDMSTQPEEIPKKEIDPDTDKMKLIQFMWENDSAFACETPNGYKGYSLGNKSAYIEFLKILAKLYPNFDKFAIKKGKEIIVSKKVGFDNNVPKFDSLFTAMCQKHGWRFYDTKNREITFSKDSERIATSIKDKSTERSIHDKSPFNKLIYNFLSEYRAHEDAIERIGNNTNVEPVERRDILFLAYMFISAYMTRASKDERESLRVYLNKEYSESKSEEEKILIDGIKDCCKHLDDKSENVSRIIKAIDDLLIAFDFPVFYDPGIFDRFIFFSLMGEIEGDPLLSGNMLLDGYLMDINEQKIIWRLSECDAVKKWAEETEDLTNGMGKI